MKNIVNNNDDKNRINNSKKMDFNRVVLQHKKEYMVKRWHKRNRNGIFPYYVRFIIEKEKNLYPSFKKSPLFKMKGNFTYDKHYHRYYSLQQFYRKKARMKIRFIQFKFIERVVQEFHKVRFYTRIRDKEIRRSNRGLRRGFYGYETENTWARLIVPTKLLTLLRYEELKSLGDGPFTDTGDYHLNSSTLALNFHRAFLNQYNEFLFVKNEKVNKSFTLLENYLNDDKYIHDVLHTMPGARWSDDEVIEPIDLGLFEPKDYNFDNANLFKRMKSDLLEIEYINELNTESDIVDSNFIGTYFDICFHVDPVNTKYFYNINLKYEDEKPAVWKAMARAAYAYEREHMMEINDDWYYIFRFYPYVLLGAGLFFPAFYTRKKPPYRLAGYKPWAKKPRYVPYIKTLYLPFQKKRFMREQIRAKGRLNISMFTKFIVFSFFFFLIFL